MRYYAIYTRWKRTCSCLSANTGSFLRPLRDADGLEDEDRGPQQDTAAGVGFENLQQGLGHDALLLGEREGRGFDRFGRRDYNSHWTRLRWGVLCTLVIPQLGWRVQSFGLALAEVTF